MIKKCLNCQKEFKIIPQEEKFYAQVNLALPEFCPTCRRERRLHFKNPRQLYKRACSRCAKEIITTYPPRLASSSGEAGAPEFSGAVYCSDCFEANFN